MATTVAAVTVVLARHSPESVRAGPLANDPVVAGSAAAGARDWIAFRAVLTETSLGTADSVSALRAVSVTVRSCFTGGAKAGARDRITWGRALAMAGLGTPLSVSAQVA